VYQLNGFPKVRGRLSGYMAKGQSHIGQAFFPGLFLVVFAQRRECGQSFQHMGIYLIRFLRSVMCNISPDFIRQAFNSKADKLVVIRMRPGDPRQIKPYTWLLREAIRTYHLCHIFRKSIAELVLGNPWLPIRQILVQFFLRFIIRCLVYFTEFFFIKKITKPVFLRAKTHRKGAIPTREKISVFDIRVSVRDSHTRTQTFPGKDIVIFMFAISFDKPEDIFCVDMCRQFVM